MAMDNFNDNINNKNDIKIDQVTSSSMVNDSCASGDASPVDKGYDEKTKIMITTSSSEPQEHSDVDDNNQQKKQLQSNYEIFVIQLKSILESISGYPIHFDGDDGNNVDNLGINLGISFDQYLELMTKDGLNNNSIDIEQFRLVYQPEIVLIRNYDKASFLQASDNDNNDDEIGNNNKFGDKQKPEKEEKQQQSQTDITKRTTILNDEVKMMKMVKSETYFYPNKITFQ